MTEYTVQHNPEEDLIRVEMRGEFNAQAQNACTSALVQEIQRTACERILIDHRQATPRLSLIEQYQRPEIAEKLGVPKTCQTAVVYLIQHHDVYRFLETVARNNHLRTRIFLDEQEALAWLNEGTPPRSRGTF